MVSEEPGGAPIGQSCSVRRISRIARHTGARSYLEIGVNRGRTFNGVQFDKKGAVDPQFQFDIRDYRHKGLKFYPMESDRYFTKHGISQKFDIIFLDGLHTFQQTFRDFCNSLACAHDRTVWLIDDVFPVDVYSAWPNQEEAIEFRKKAGGSGGNGIKWHGDVFKVLFVIHDFFPMLSYVTLREGNPQAVVWRSPRVEFSPAFGSMEAIERLSYFDLLGRQDLLNVRPEAVGLRQFAEWASANPSHAGSMPDAAAGWGTAMERMEDERGGKR